MLEQTGTVYILENSHANRVKIGVTVNDPEERLKDINRMWIGIKGRCQICLSWRLLLGDGRMPNHVLSGTPCFGSNQLPFERSTELAQLKLKDLKDLVNEYSGHKKISAVKKIKTLERAIESYRLQPKQLGTWVIRASFYCKKAYQVEMIVHEALTNYIDKSAPFGEVFSCSVEEAIVAVENALIHLGVME